MEIYLIRHTRPSTAAGLIYGRLDVALADSFAIEAAQTLKSLPVSFGKVYSSPSSRCTRLAALITADYQKDEALYELDFGDWEGMTWDTINREASDAWMKDFVHLSPPNGETMLQMQQRVLNFWNDLLLQPYENAAVVTHGGVIRILLAQLQSVALQDAFSIKVEMGEVFFVKT